MGAALEEKVAVGSGLEPKAEMTGQRVLMIVVHLQHLTLGKVSP